jgi:hypothetical protein
MPASIVEFNTIGLSNCKPIKIAVVEAPTM